jgi:hypothetical protein
MAPSRPKAEPRRDVLGASSPHSEGLEAAEAIFANIAKMGVFQKLLTETTLVEWFLPAAGMFGSDFRVEGPKHLMKSHK